LDQPGEFIRGDANHDLRVEISDAVSSLLCLCSSRSLSCVDAADTDDNEAVNITDAIVALDFLFREGPAPRRHSPPRESTPRAMARSTASDAAAVQHFRMALRP